MTKTYTATISHHSISRARHIKIDGTLTKAKAAATREFGGEERDYEISIYEHTPRKNWFDREERVAFRKVGARKWQDCL